MTIAINTSEIEDITYKSGLYTGLYFFSNNAQPSASDTLTTGQDGAKNLLYTLTTITKSIVNTNLLIAFALPLSNFFPSSTITGSGSTTTTLNLVTTNGFSVRDRIMVEVAGNFQRMCITGISTNTLTVVAVDVNGNIQTGKGLISAPIAGTLVKVLCCQIAVKKTGASGIAYILTDESYKIANVPLNGTITIKDTI